MLKRAGEFSTTALEAEHLSRRNQTFDQNCPLARQPWKHTVKEKIQFFRVKVMITVPQKGVGKRGRPKGIGKKVTKNEKKVTKNKSDRKREKVTKKWAKKNVSGLPPFAYPLLRHVELRISTHTRHVCSVDLAPSSLQKKSLSCACNQAVFRETEEVGSMLPIGTVKSQSSFMMESCGLAQIMKVIHMQGEALQRERER